MNESYILLFYPKTSHEKNYKFYWMPYSLLSIATYISNKGYRIKIVDNNTNAFTRKSEFIKETIEQAKIVGISSMIGKQMIDGCEFATYVRKINPNATIVWGGYAPSLLPELFAKQKFVDIVVRGQGEKTFLEIVETIFSGGKLEKIKGIVYTKNGEVIYNPNRELINLNERPPYPFSLINVSEYIRDDDEINAKTINYVSSQGCPFKCGFCSEVSMYQCKWLHLSAEKIVRDIKYLYNNYQINGVKFYDANFFTNKNRVMQFIKSLNKNKIILRWAASAHPNNLSILNDREWKSLGNSGCSRILVGAESGSQEVLNLTHKNITIEKIKQTAQRLSKYGIIGSFTFIVGFPEEPPDSVEKTLVFAEELLSINEKFEAKIHFYLPYPGTPLFKSAISHGFLPPTTLEEWGTYDYYCTEMPWVDKSLYKIIHEFNECYCPYVQKTLTGTSYEN